MNFISLIIIPIILFLAALIGIFLNRRNILLIIICVELMLLAINFIFILTSFYLDDVLGQIFSIFILAVAAAESSIGLAILISFYRVKGTIAIDFVGKLKG
jgi:NADH:ubiquinone oxidoreductase subunit K